MQEEHLVKLAAMLDPKIWKQPELTIREMLKAQQGYDMLNPDTMKKAILRSGIALSKDEKKQRGINPAAKVHDGIIKQFTDEHMSECVGLVEELALAVAAVQGETSKLRDWSRNGIKNVTFAPAPDCCPACEKLRGSYMVEECPIAVLNTHLGCRCCITCDASSFN